MQKIKEIIYKAREGAPFGDEKAKELALYMEENELESPDEVLDDALKNEKSPFREFIEWDKEKAFIKYAKESVKHVVASISVEIKFVGGETVRFKRAYNIVRIGGANFYAPTEDALTSEESRKQILNRAYGNLKGWQETYGNYLEFAKIVSAIDEVDPSEF